MLLPLKRHRNIGSKMALLAKSRVTAVARRIKGDVIRSNEQQVGWRYRGLLRGRMVSLAKPDSTDVDRGTTTRNVENQLLLRYLVRDDIHTTTTLPHLL